MTARRNGIPMLAESLDLSVENLFTFTGDWRSEALCSQLPVDEADRMFFPQRGGSTKAARELCARCPAVEDCLRFALYDDDAFYNGVWGGTSSRERRQLRRGSKVA